MRDFLNEVNLLLRNKKNIINLLLLGIMVLAIPLTIKLVRQQQILFSRAQAAKVEFLTQAEGGTDCVINRGGNKVAVCNDLKLRFTAPTGDDIHFQGRTALSPAGRQSYGLLPQEGLVSTVYAVDPVQPGECAGDDWYRPADGGAMVSCVAQGRRCFGGQGCLAACTYNEDPRNCPSGGTRTCHGTTDGSSCRYNPGVDPACSETCNPTPSVGGPSSGVPVGQCPNWEFNSSTPPVCGQDIGGTAGQECRFEVDTCTGGTRLKAGSCQVVQGSRCILDSGGSSGQICGDYQQACAGGGYQQCHSGVTQSDNSCGAGRGSSCDPDCIGVVVATGCPNGVQIGQTACTAYGDNNHKVCGSGSTPANPIWQTVPCPSGQTCTRVALGRDSCQPTGGTETTCYVCRSGTLGLSGDQTRCNTLNAPNCPNLSSPDNFCKGAASYLDDVSHRSCGTSTEKCFVCENNRYRYAGADGVLTADCPTTTCNPANANTCRSSQDLRTQSCNTAAAPVITKFRFAEDPSDLAGATVNSYQQGGVTVPHTLSDTLGQKSIWYQFGDDGGNWTEQRRGGILLVGPDPVITGAACNLDIKDGSLLFAVRGSNFGNRDFTNSRLDADNSNLEIKDWLGFTVIGRMANPPDTTTGKTYVINLTRSDGVRASATCSINTTQVSLGAKLFCRTPSNFDQDDVKLTIIQNDASPSATFQVGNKARETVTITKEGVIQNLRTKLEDGVEYKVCIKAPKSLQICSDKFTAVSGNNIIQNFNLPIGDVNNDESINSVDAGICKAQWGPAGGSGAKVCEFNRDNTTNSFEWSCLLHDFGKSSQAEPI